MNRHQKLPQRAKYGLDAPGILYGCFIAWAIFLILQLLCPFGILWWVGQILSLPFGIIMLLYGTYGKFRHRDRMLSMIQWKGNERVLDVGTGLGLLLIGAAKRLTTGKAVGIDIWSAKDLSGNFAAATLKNAELEGVKDKVEILSEDARALSFADNSFDVILSNLCIHNIPPKEGRAQACFEIARVLKSGGVALISDFQKTDEYTEVFLKEGLQVEKLGPYWKNTFLGLTILKVTK
jgi:ubiquinone/menaquinone biosynthesis C-methylase UbiE